MKNGSDGCRARHNAPATHELGELRAPPDPLVQATPAGLDCLGQAIALPIQLDGSEHVVITAYRLNAGARLVAVCGRCGAGAEIILDACVIPEPLTECSAEWLKDAAVAFGQILDAVGTLIGSWAPAHLACAAPAVERRTPSTIGEEAVPVVSDWGKGDRVH